MLAESSLAGAPLPASFSGQQSWLAAGIDRIGQRGAATAFATPLAARANARKMVKKTRRMMVGIVPTGRQTVNMGGAAPVDASPLQCNPIRRQR
jgi:hypothetical protein